MTMSEYAEIYTDTAIVRFETNGHGVPMEKSVMSERNSFVFRSGIVTVTFVPPDSLCMISIFPPHIHSSLCLMFARVVCVSFISDASNPGPLSSTTIMLALSVRQVRIAT